ncbi:class C beta-lactamase-related serine hydrolase [Oceanobacillus piezotolerans]|uniref:Class C beta-lactamase-related serine hydrolase n=1 Tax=Oceanobacillus piezotolerans TaxID=2448030 RepID=A0A498DIJ1_9BACI|nr:serine hydrolase [Oceanobacillus piezotolerans]RLL48369.1 class C beta-lactamase-related serine hydrolase [Oceanobacillus piezotolerans]
MDKQMNWNSLAKKQQQLQFSGSIHVRRSGETILSESFGYAIYSEGIVNQSSTRFSIASGSKIFTSIAICQLVDEGKITFDTKIIDCLDINFPYFDERITIHHLLTHTSGVPDYFDEEEMDDFEVLWETLPMYHVRNAEDFLPMFQQKKMQGKVGGPFKYNNTGYIILGLVIEQISGMDFVDYIEKNIFQKAGMNDSGYFPMDELPGNISIGYIKKSDGTWKSNIFSLPAKGGPDGGAYVTATEMGAFWEALMNGRLLSKEMTRILLTPQEKVADDIFYSYGGYLQTNEHGVVKYIQMGYDPGVNFRSVHYPEQDLTIIVCSNKSEGAFEMLKEIESLTIIK